MKKTASLLLTLCLLLGCVSLLSGCADRLRYENDDAYSVGSFETDARIHSLEIYWEGNILSVSGAYTDKIKAEETYDRTGAKAMRYLVEEGTLKIYPAASGKNVGNLEKSLFLELPMDMANSLTSVTIHALDETEVMLSLISAETLFVSAEDGDVDFEGALDRVRVETQKGDFKAKSATVSDLEFASVTGNADVSLHLQGFTAVMRNADGSFETDYEIEQNEVMYTYGTQETVLLFDTEGTVKLHKYSLTK